MPTMIIFELSGDPFFGAPVTVSDSFIVEITDDDATIEDPDTGPSGVDQFDVSDILGLSDSNDFQAFESYTGTIGSETVTFTLIQFSGQILMFVTDGTVIEGDTIAAPSVVTFSAPTVDYVDLPNFVCFADGTLILTRKGQMLVEDLEVGDEVLTMDNGYQAIRWIGSRALDAIDLAANPNVKPIRIKAGALGAGLPEQDLVVSPQHRVLARSAVALRMFGATEVLIPAKKLLDLDGVDIDLEATNVTYNHFLFARHEIVFSNGAPTESMFTGAEALKSVGSAARREITTLFPEIATREFTPCPARHIPEKGRAMQKFAYRIQKNNKRVVEQLM